MNDVDMVSEGHSEKLLFTIGHGTRSADDFLQLLTKHDIDVLVDIRTSPWSKFAPQFNQVNLQAFLSDAGVRYIPMGDSLGGRPTEDHFYDTEGHALYNLMATSGDFLNGIDVLEQKCGEHKIALMCSESDHLVCHRYLLVAEVLNQNGLIVHHIDKFGNEVPHESIFAEEANTLFALEGGPTWRSLLSVRRAQTDEN